MIRSLKVKSGYAHELPALKRTLRFEPGLNVLFGQNACGKTSALAIMGAHCGCPHDSGGWSRFIQPFYSMADKREKYPKLFTHISPGGCGADVEWDGTATFFRPASVVKRLFEESDPLYDDHDMICALFAKASSGAEKANELFRIEAAMQSPPDIGATPKNVYAAVSGQTLNYDGCNELWQKAIDSFTDYVKTLPRSGPPTLLLDEPDRSLSIPNTVGLWIGFLPRLAKTCQVVVASHSPFVLDAPGANIIEMHEGYLDLCRKAMEKAKGEKR